MVRSAHDYGKCALGSGNSSKDQYEAAQIDGGQAVAVLLLCHSAPYQDGGGTAGGSKDRVDF